MTRAEIEAEKEGGTATKREIVIERGGGIVRGGGTVTRTEGEIVTVVMKEDVVEAERGTGGMTGTTGGGLTVQTLERGTVRTPERGTVQTPERGTVQTPGRESIGSGTERELVGAEAGKGL